MESKAITTLILILFSNVLLHQCQAKNILCILGVGTESAEKWNKVLLTELAAKGHDLTIITPSVWDDDDSPNINFIHLENTKKFLKHRYENDSDQSLLEQSTWKYIVNWYDQQMATCRGNLESIGFSESLHLGLKGKRSYDLIIYDVTYGPGCLLHLAYLFKKVPIVGITGSSLTADILNINQHSTLNAALDPYILSDFTQSMSYWKRLYNAALHVFDYSYRQWVVRPVVEGLWSHNMHAKNLKVPKSVDDLLPRIKVVLANYHPALHTLTALPANVVPVPGLHIDAAQALDSDIITFMDKSKLGVIYIDLNFKKIGESNAKELLGAVGKISDYGFIWNIGKNYKLNLKQPSNVLIGNDFRNSDLLDHTKIKAFLTIPEILTTQEAIYFGKPIIAVTLRPEQRYIAKRIEDQGFGITFELNNFSAEIIAGSIKKCLEDKSLHKSAKLLQQSLKNQQTPALETAIWWVEHIMKYPQANDHLFALNTRSLGFFARNSLDMIFLFEFLIFICIVNTIIVFRQTIQNFKKISKAKAKEAKTKEEKSAKVKKSKKAKTKTS